MKLFKTYRGDNFPRIYLVVEKAERPENIVPFNILYMFGHMQLVKGSMLSSHLPFSKGGQKRILETIHDTGFCFYKWPGKILGPTLGDPLDVEP